MIRVLSLSVLLMTVWLLFSGHYTLLHISLGVASVLVSVWIARRMDVVDYEGQPIAISVAAVGYFPWLLWEVIKSNIDVAKRILSPSLPISPRVFRVTASQRTAVGRTIYANSITLTPGTVTIQVRGNEFEVHALTSDTEESLRTGKMDARVARMEGTPPSAPFPPGSTEHLALSARGEERGEGREPGENDRGGTAGAGENRPGRPGGGEEDR